MTKRKTTSQLDDVNQSPLPHPDVPPMPQRGREVIYTIVVPGCNDTVAIERARRELVSRQVRPALIRIDVERGVVSVPRLFTLWQGDDLERVWQQSIQKALPGALIDVADWTPGYPQSDMGEPTNG